MDHGRHHNGKRKPVKADRRHVIVGAAALAASGCVDGRGGSDTAPRIRWLARRERALQIYTNTSLMGPVLAAFRRLYPEIVVRLEDMNSTRMAEQVEALANAGEEGPDIVWSTAMDVQVKLINDGYAQAYRSPHRLAMPDGSVWRDQGFGVTAEPIVFAYNRRLVPQEAVPASHSDLLRLLETRRDVFDRRVTLYDAERSGVAMMQLSADTQIYPDAWRLMDALGATRPRVDTSGQRMMGQIADGRMVFAYNMNQSYGGSWAARIPDIGLVTPRDYHLSVSRVAFIPRNAAHPNAARLFLDYLLSRAGQNVIASLGIRPVRDDVQGARRPAAPGVRPIRVGPALLANLDRERRDRLLLRWGQAMGDAPRAPVDFTAP